MSVLAENVPIWPGSSSFFPGDTPFGYYDNDARFQCDAEKVADWCAKRLGYPVMRVEMQDVHFYTAFEEAISEYQNLVNTYSARDNILSVMGFHTGSQTSNNYSEKRIDPTLSGIVQIAKNYGTEAGSGGNLVWYTGSIDVSENKQVYSFSDDVVTIETGSFAVNRYTIRKVFHNQIPGILRYGDPYTGLGIMESVNAFGWNNMLPANSYEMTPLYVDILRANAVELNDQIRRSEYSFQITGNRIRIFPRPTADFRMWFAYTIDDDSDPYNQTDQYSTGVITNHSNIPYYKVNYSYINDLGVQWIKKYALALSKEILGYIRGKYSTVPIPDQEATLNGDALLTAAQEEKTALVDKLNEILDSFSRQAQLERKNAETEAIQNQLKNVPMAIYIR